MASRIVFLPNFISEHELFQEKLVTFDWVPGIAVSQAKKSIRNLHEAAGKQIGLTKILEVSTRSEVILGISLSAFNLQFENKNFSVESAYQASKVFEKGGPYLDLLNLSSTDAKTDLRLKNSGLLTGFRFEGEDFAVTSAPNFYDYLYIRSLLFFSDRHLLKNYDEPEEMWSVVSTGVLTRGLQVGFPNAKMRGVCVARNMKYGELGRTEIISEPLSSYPVPVFEK
jgi:hypothetical protein